MNTKKGLKLIESLKNDPKKFCEQGKEYPLLVEYFRGLPIETLRPLFYFEDKQIKHTAIWIASELGSKQGWPLLKEALMLFNDNNSDTYSIYLAADVIVNCAHGEYLCEFVKTILLLEHADPVLRQLTILRISGLSKDRIQDAYGYMVNRKGYDDHEKGLLALLHIDEITPLEVTQMINSDKVLDRKYGIAIARKLYRKYPQIIHDAVNHQDSDVSEFAKVDISARNRNRNLR